MTNVLSSMEYPHWRMVAGAVLAVVGFIGFAFRQNRNGSVNESGTGNTPPTERLEAMREIRIRIG